MMKEIARRHEIESFRSEYQRSHSYVFYVCMREKRMPGS